MPTKVTCRNRLENLLTVDENPILDDRYVFDNCDYTRLWPEPNLRTLAIENLDKYDLTIYYSNATLKDFEMQDDNYMFEGLLNNLMIKKIQVSDENKPEEFGPRNVQFVNEESLLEEHSYYENNYECSEVFQLKIILNGFNYTYKMMEKINHEGDLVVIFDDLWSEEFKHYIEDGRRLKTRLIFLLYPTTNKQFREQNIEFQSQFILNLANYNLMLDYNDYNYNRLWHNHTTPTHKQAYLPALKSNFVTYPKDKKEFGLFDEILIKIKDRLNLSIDQSDEIELLRAGSRRDSLSSNIDDFCECCKENIDQFETLIFNILKKFATDSSQIDSNYLENEMLDDWRKNVSSKNQYRNKQALYGIINDKQQQEVEYFPILYDINERRERGKFIDFESVYNHFSSLKSGYKCDCQETMEIIKNFTLWKYVHKYDTLTELERRGWISAQDNEFIPFTNNDNLSKAVKEDSDSAVKEIVKQCIKNKKFGFEQKISGLINYG